LERCNIRVSLPIYAPKPFGNNLSGTGGKRISATVDDNYDQDAVISIIYMLPLWLPVEMIHYSSDNG